MINKTGENEMYLLVGLFLASFQLVQSKVRDLAHPTGVDKAVARP